MQLRLAQSDEANLEVVLQFMDGFKNKNFEKIRATLHDQFLHRSPFDEIVGADKFLSEFFEKISGIDWSYRFTGSVAQDDTIVLRYDSLIPGMEPVPMLEYFKLKSGKITVAEDYILKIPPQVKSGSP